LDLKKGYIYILIRNLSINKNLIKNARVIIIYLYEYSIKVKLICGVVGIIYNISKINFKFILKFTPYTILRR
ncbi:hypothetical protein BDR22DRAFT_804109, partial [Usnea florida]